MIFRILGERGRITIPYETRQRMGFKANDILSFEEKDNNTIVIRREKICSGCKYPKDECDPIVKPTDETTLRDFLDSLSAAEKRAAFVYLSMKWAEAQRGTSDDN